MKVEPTNISALLGCLGIAQPMIYVPSKDGRGYKYATWDKVTHSRDDKDTAYQIAWLLSGIPDEGSETYSERKDRFKAQAVPQSFHDSEDNPPPQIPESQLAWMISLRAATLFNAIHGEHHSL